MSKKSATNVMRIMGATLAVCSAMAIVGSSKTGNCTAKKTMKNAMNKMSDIVDTVTSFM